MVYTRTANMKIVFCLWFIALGAVSAEKCISRDFGASSIACVCNSTYCDSLDRIRDTEISCGSFVQYTSNKDGLRLNKTIARFTTANAVEKATQASFTVVRNTTYQTIFGFGGALTDSAALNIMNLSQKASDNLLRSYFGRGSSQYTFVKTPMAGTDYSVSYYSYADVQDVELKSFGLTDIDYKKKIPIIKKASEMSRQDIKLFTAPWTAPWWMRINSTRIHLNETYHQAFANYFVKYLDAYANEDIDFWGLSPQSEPTFPYTARKWIPYMAFTEKQMVEWVGDYLGPTLDKAGYCHLKMMLLDDKRSKLSSYAETILTDAKVKKYASGIALHWYNDRPGTSSVLTAFHKNHSDEPMLYTQACIGTRMTVNNIGNWEYGESYMNGMFLAFNNWVTGWTDWNLALNEEGGPRLVGGELQSHGYPAAIHVNSTADEFYKQPIYYVQAHFSSFVPPRSKRVQLQSSPKTGLQSIAFLTPEDRVVVILANTNSNTVTTTISENNKGSIAVEVGPRSIHTIVYK